VCDLEKQNVNYADVSVQSITEYSIGVWYAMKVILRGNIAPPYPVRKFVTINALFCNLVY